MMTQSGVRRLTRLQGASTSSRAGLRQGFSLIEVMIALAVVIVLAALVFPMFSGFSESVEFKETCDQLSSAVSVCRSEAQRRGTPMELVTRKESDGRVSIVGQPAKFDKSKESGNKAGSKGGQVLMVLPQGYSIDHESGMAGSTDAPASTSSDETGDDAAPAIAPTPDTDEDDSTPKPLVVFWASGGASKCPGLFLHGRGGRLAGAEINSFTGLLRLEQLADGTDEKSKSDAKPDAKADSKSDAKQSGKPNPGKPDGPPDVDPNGP